MQTLDEIFIHGTEFTAHTFPLLGKIFPTWICVTEDGDILPVVANDDDFSDRKDQFIANLREFMRIKGVVRFVSLVECWMLEGSKDEIPQEVISGQKAVRDCANRVEAIWISAEDNSGKSRSGYYYIKRDTDGKATLSELHDMPIDGMQSGRFTDLITPQQQH